VDAVIVHNTTSELQFLEAGHGVARREFMINDFVLVGPRRDPAGAAAAASVFDALACIAREEALFMSRGDDSGTNLRELELWGASAALPFGLPWYRMVEGGMIRCLEAASREAAYTLADSGTFLAQARGLKLKIICADPDHLRNAYSIIAVNPARHAHVRHGAAEAFAEFLISPGGQKLIGSFRSSGRSSGRGGRPLFYPLWPTREEGAGGRPAVGKTGQGGSRGRNR
jgi:tungstate transport system substrate-binding protein